MLIWLIFCSINETVPHRSVRKITLALSFYCKWPRRNLSVTEWRAGRDSKRRLEKLAVPYTLPKGHPSANISPGRGWCAESGGGMMLQALGGGEFALRLASRQRVAPLYWRSDTHTHTCYLQQRVLDQCNQDQFLPQDDNVGTQTYTLLIHCRKCVTTLVVLNLCTIFVVDVKVV